MANAKKPVIKGKKARKNGILVRPDYLISASFSPPSTIRLHFADAMKCRLPIRRLEMPVDRIRWSTVCASPTGEFMTVAGIKGETIPIDSSTLRCLVDPEYAVEKEKELDALQLSREEMQSLAGESQPPKELKPATDRYKITKTW